MGKKLKVTFNAQNIGPHKNLNNTLEFSSLKIGVFANNGSGKTFLSRMFRMVNESNINDSNKALSMGTTTGSFSFQIEEKDESTQQLEINLSKDNEPLVNNDTEYIYHVFNSDFVRENIEESKYRPDGDIEGYILGKSTIDLKKEKLELEELEKKIVEKGENFSTAVSEAKSELDDLQIRKNINEYKFSDSDVIDKKLDYSDALSFDAIKQLNTNLNSMPDDLEDVSELILTAKNGFLSEIGETLEGKYTRSSFSQEFKDKIDSGHIFIKEGLDILPEQKVSLRC